MIVAQLESPLHHPPPPISLGSEAVGLPLAFVPRTQARSNDRVPEEAFIWTVAHELRQPLSTMTTAVAVMEHDSSAGATAHAIGVMRRQLQHMSRMVDDLVDAARLSTGKVSLVPQRLDLREVMMEAAADVAAEAAKRGQLLNVKDGAAPLWVNGDRQRLYQVFSNLLRNAIKFTGHGGRITFTADSHMSRIAVRVRDTGCGIDRQALPLIFDLFTQVQPSGLGGVGIGLSVAREIVSLHRGRIEAHSDGPGMGSEFEVTLPASPAGGSSAVGCRS
jgi:two-component system, sensor histidine kinase